MPIGLQPNFVSFLLIVILYVGIPLGVIYVIFRVIRNGRDLAASRQAETQRLLNEVIELLKENNRLLSETRASK